MSRAVKERKSILLRYDKGDEYLLLEAFEKIYQAIAEGMFAATIFVGGKPFFYRIGGGD